MSYITKSKVGIIGAGFSGISAAKQLSEHNPVVFEATGSIGGVWTTCCYESTKLQSPRRFFEFSDFPWADRRDSTSLPSHKDILDYLVSYATHFDVVRFNSKVVQLRFTGDINVQRRSYGNGSLLSGFPMWEVGVRSSCDESDVIQWHAFEFVVICTGKHGDIPSIPEFKQSEGPEVFQGKVMHTLDYCKLDKDGSVELLRGKKVVIIGSKKSAIDLAVECAEANQGPEGQPCTLVVRTPHWTLPDNLSIWGVPFYWFYSTRAAQFLHETPNQGLVKTLLCNLLSPIRRALSKTVESYLTRKLPLEKYGLVPDHPFEEDFASCQAVILPENLFSKADKGKIRFERASNKWCFWERGVRFEDGRKIDADVVIFATGFEGKQKFRDIIPESFHGVLEFPSGMMPLYRGTINPLITNMAFIGYIESIPNLYTIELSCKWLSRLLTNNRPFELPSSEKMIEHVVKEMKIAKKTSRFYKKGCVTIRSKSYIDGIIHEMGS